MPALSGTEIGAKRKKEHKDMESAVLTDESKNSHPYASLISSSPDSTRWHIFMDES